MASSNFLLFDTFFKHSFVHNKESYKTLYENTQSYYDFRTFTTDIRSKAYKIYRDHLIWDTDQSTQKLLP